MSDGINISAAELAQWEKDKAAFLRQIADLQEKLGDVTKKLDAAATLKAINKPQSAQAPAVPATNGQSQRDAHSMTSAITQIANQSSAPVSKKDLKKKLSDMGFSEDRLGPYFYTVIMRLKGKKLIRVMGDGSVWKTLPSGMNG